MQRMSKRVTLNRQVVDELVLGYADGLQAVGEMIIAAAHPPDATPYGKGLVKGGRVTTYFGGKRIAGKGTPSRGSILQRGLVTIVGFLFPGRFQEVGTQHQPARPFLTPAFVGVIGYAAVNTIVRAMQARLRLVRS